MTMKIKGNLNKPSLDAFLIQMFNTYENCRSALAAPNGRFAVCASPEHTIEAVVESATWLDGPFQYAADATIAKYVIQVAWSRFGDIDPAELYDYICRQLVNASMRSKSSSTTHTLMDACLAQAWGNAARHLNLEFPFLSGG